MTATNVTYTVPLKSVGTTYLLWLFFGIIGAHKFYLGKPAVGVVYALTLGVLGLGNLVDLFTIPSQVRTANAALMGQTDPERVSSGTQLVQVAVLVLLGLVCVGFVAWSTNPGV